MSNEKPILFSGEMVRAILEGRKAQTRRSVKCPAWFEGHLIYYKEGIGTACNISSRDGAQQISCPYGQVGDRLWVKETHLPKASGTIYRADFDSVEAAGIGAMYGGWKPSIFCKRIYSRITLEIASVRAERLQDISHRDALAEGVTYDVSKPDGSPLARYKTLWESINGKGSWAKNPWVWVIEFKRILP